MRAYAAADYGLYVTAEDLKEYAERNGCDENDALFDAGNVYNGAEGECFLVMKDEHETLDITDCFAILPLNKYPTLFTRAYESKAEALAELKENYSHYLATDFDYEGRFVRFTGAVYG